MASYIRRRHFLATLLGGAAAWPLATRAQQRPGKVARIGFLGVGPASAWADSVEALRSGLRDLRHVEGKDILIEFRWAERIDQLPEMAAELVHMDVDIIIAPASTEVEPARQATKIIPIVFTQHADPVGIGHVSESRAAWWKHHRDVDGSNRPCRQGNWKFSKMLYRMLLGLVSSGTLRRPPTQRS